MPMMQPQYMNAKHKNLKLDRTKEEGKSSENIANIHHQEESYDHNQVQVQPTNNLSSPSKGGIYNVIFL
jgi:hypothetical protein